MASSARSLAHAPTVDAFWSSRRPSGRAAGLGLLTAAVAGLLAYMALEVPVAADAPPHGRLLFCPLSAPPVPRQLAVHHWRGALLAALVVTALVSLVVAAALRRGRREPPRSAPGAAARTRLSVPRPLGLQRVPVRVAAITGAASLFLVAAGAVKGYPLWVVALLGLGPWLPVLCVEAVWKYEHYGLYAFFVAIVLLQLGHMGEHTVQVSQLMATHGELASSHGVFGQLDFETVHFFWDSAIWVSLGVLLYRFGRGNPWLWVAFAASSLHEVEHLYLYWLYNAHRAFYLQGGFEGIMGNGGVIGSPLARPYLHFAYNFIVTTPMAVALWDETKRVELRTSDGELERGASSRGELPVGRAYGPPVPEAAEG